MKTALFALGLCAFLAGCDSDETAGAVKASSGEPDRSEREEDREAPEAEDSTAEGAAATRDSEREPDAAPLYALMYEVFDDVGSNSYLTMLDSLDISSIDPADGREYAGGRAFLATYAGSVYVGDAEAPIVTRYTVDESGELHEEGRISFSNYGLESGVIDAWSVNFVSKDKAYLFDSTDGLHIIWDPTKMEILGEIEPPSELGREGYDLDTSPAVIRGNRMFRSYGWVNWDEGDWADEQLLAVYDTETDTLIDLVEETRCPSHGNLVHEDEAGNFYFSNWIWPVAETLTSDGPSRCVLKLPADSERFDADWSLSYSDFADGREGAMFTYAGDGQALASIFYDEKVPMDDESMSTEYAGQPFWRVWSMDLEGDSAAPVEGIEFNTGAYTPVRLDGRTFLMVPGENWETTQVYEIKDGRGSKLVEIPGWSYQFVKVR
jgi:hypothetical protein